MTSLSTGVQSGPQWSPSSSTRGSPSRRAIPVAVVVFPEPGAPTTTTRRIGVTPSPTTSPAGRPPALPAPRTRSTREHRVIVWPPVDEEVTHLPHGFGERRQFVDRGRPIDEPAEPSGDALAHGGDAPRGIRVACLVDLPRDRRHEPCRARRRELAVPAGRVDDAETFAVRRVGACHERRRQRRDAPARGERHRQIRRVEQHVPDRRILEVVARSPSSTRRTLSGHGSPCTMPAVRARLRRWRSRSASRSTSTVRSRRSRARRGARATRRDSCRRGMPSRSRSPSACTRGRACAARTCPRCAMPTACRSAMPSA